MELPNRELLITVEDLWYPVGVDVLQQVFASYGALESIEIHLASPSVQATVKFAKLDAAIKAKDLLHDRYIYNGCCLLKIHFSQPVALPILDTVLSSASAASYGTLSSMEEDFTEAEFLSLEKSLAKLNHMISKQNVVLDSICSRLQQQSQQLARNETEEDPRVEEVPSGLLKEGFVQEPYHVQIDNDGTIIPHYMNVRYEHKRVGVSLINHQAMNCYSSGIEKLVASTFPAEVNHLLIEDLLPIAPAEGMLPCVILESSKTSNEVELKQNLSTMSTGTSNWHLPFSTSSEYVDISLLFQHDGMDAIGLFELMIAIFFILVVLHSCYTCIFRCWKFFVFDTG